MRRRETYNFAAEEQQINASELDSAVATANLISIMDPKELGDEEVELISDATGASKEFVDEMADLCNDACEACDAGHKPEEVKQHFSAAAEELINSYVESCNFSAPEKMDEDSPEETVLQVAQLTTLVDDELLKDKPEEVAEVISEATGVDKDAVEDVVETAKEHFSNGNVFYIEMEDLVNFAKAKIAAKGALKGIKGLKSIASKAEKAGKEAIAAFKKDAELAAKAKTKEAKKVVLAQEKAIAKAGGSQKAAGQAAEAAEAKISKIKLSDKANKKIAKDAAKAGEKAEAKAMKEGLHGLGFLTKGETAAIAGVGALGAGGAGYAAGKNFSEETEEVVTETIVPEPTTIAQEGAVKEGVSDTQPVEGTAQDPVKAAEIDPKEGDKVQDTTSAEAALKVQNDLATVETAADVTPAETNFGRQNLTGKEVTAGLKSLLGARYIPNK